MVLLTSPASSSRLEREREREKTSGDREQKQKKQNQQPQHGAWAAYHGARAPYTKTQDAKKGTATASDVEGITTRGQRGSGLPACAPSRTEA